jgi:hypothetical protein
MKALSVELPKAYDITISGRWEQRVYGGKKAKFSSFI